MNFLEILPSNCPIGEASEQNVEGAYRIVSSMQPKIEDFLSHAALGKGQPPTVDPCRFASCSMLLSRDRAVDIATKLAKPRSSDKYLATCNLESHHGMSYVNKKHIDFWPYKEFNIEDVVIEVEKI